MRWVGKFNLKLASGEMWQPEQTETKGSKRASMHASKFFWGRDPFKKPQSITVFLRGLFFFSWPESNIVSHTSSKGYGALWSTQTEAICDSAVIYPPLFFGGGGTSSKTESITWLPLSKAGPKVITPRTFHQNLGKMNSILTSNKLMYRINP